MCPVFFKTRKKKSPQNSKTVEARNRGQTDIHRCHNGHQRQQVSSIYRYNGSVTCITRDDFIMITVINYNTHKSTSDAIGKKVEMSIPEKMTLCMKIQREQLPLHPQEDLTWRSALPMWPLLPALHSHLQSLKLQSGYYELWMTSLDTNQSIA